MNILIDDLPVEVDGVPVYTDFRNMVMFEQLMCDDDMNNYEKLCASIDLFYKKPVSDIKKAWDGLLWFYSGGNRNTDEKTEKRNKTRRFSPAYDFEQDAERIYSAFWQVYNVDLQSAPLHWWSFRAMLGSLPETCLIGEVMRIRLTDTSKLKGAEKKRIKRLQEIYSIKRKVVKDIMTAAESEKKMREYVLKRHREAEEWLRSQKNK